MPQAPKPLSDIEVLIPAHDIHARVKGIAQDIAADFKVDLMIISLLRGSFVFTSDLIRELHYQGCQPQVDFMTLASYGRGTTSSGEVQLVRDIVESVEGRDVLIVDDILESGRTLTFARELIKSRGARAVKIAVLLEKPGKRRWLLMRIIWASSCRINSWWDTGWTMPTFTASYLLLG